MDKQIFQLIIAGSPLLRSVSKLGAALSTLTTSPIFRIPDSVDAADGIAVDIGEYRLYDAGVWGDWTSDAGVRGTATKIQFRLTSSAAYETQVVQTATVDAVEYTVSVTTLAEASSEATYWTDVNGNNILDVNDNPIEVNAP